MKYFRILFSAAALLLAASCIDNDVPYPVVELRIAGVEGSGFTVSGISIANRTVALTLDEKTDIRKVGIDIATSNPMMTDTESFIGQIKTSRPLSGEFDLRSPLYVTLSLYQDYEWTIVAEQPIERAFTVAGQIGATVIDAQKRTATAYVAKGTNWVLPTSRPTLPRRKNSRLRASKRCVSSMRPITERPNAGRSMSSIPT